MYCTREITENLYWVGSSDRRLALFENLYEIPRGIAYNSYLLKDDKMVLFDTVDHSISRVFFENIAYCLQGRPLDYLIINHIEPDHCSSIDELVLRYPNVKFVCSSKAAVMLKQFFKFDVESRTLVVKEGDTLCVGEHTLSFYMAPMVHWPEVMVTYDSASKVLFSADAFGTFGALSGNIFADELDFPRDWLDDARRYYTNIVGKYGTQVQSLLKKASALDIEYICPLHGPIWRSNINYFLDKYQKWSAYMPEDNAVLIAYASVYGNTENAANILAVRLADLGVKNIAMYDVSKTSGSYIVAEAFRCSHIALLSTTYNMEVFSKMEVLLSELKAHNLQNRTVAVVQNGSWAPSADKNIREALSQMKNMKVLENAITIKSSLKEEQMTELDELAKAIVASMS
ncbi:MAG TPA: FprA family A-type flavoprotein [Clostridia bacterium]|nr:FprA family A-type flavoprotein [Clostridia bacterium]